MGTTSTSSALLLILNIFHVILGLAIASASLWFFVEVYGITSLRNSNHYLLDYNVYWPQAIPWVFILAGLIVICVSCCGFVGAKKKSSGLVGMYTTFQIIAVCVLITAAVLALVFADSKSADKFVEDAIWDAYTHMKNDISVEKDFGNMEKRFQCCGAAGPRDYINWKREFPVSCCDTYYHGWIGSYNIDCDFTNKLANERHGCSEVATNYNRVIIRVLSGACIFTAFIGIMNIIVAVTLSKGIRSRPRLPVSVQEFESKKVLL